ncbi:MAG: hypothetical protein KIT80_10165 [Chitinophagaceae bacterium]|nr:hypothetical protein [Chitinophagaceae bacterium]MCW5927265.1 hypothetical protein [Chitinophagaceae bacterium]
MRLWSLHPGYLDAKGLVALWREALLAKHVLEGKTKGYKNHPQLTRFKNTKDPVHAINQYLSIVHKEAVKRGYNFDKAKITPGFSRTKIKLSTGQLKYEWKHLLEKLKERNPERFKALAKIRLPDTVAMFTVTEGAVEDWEIISVRK